MNLPPLRGRLDYHPHKRLTNPRVHKSLPPLAPWGVGSPLRKLRGRVLLHTKFVEKNDLVSIGLYNGIRTLLERRGLHGFMKVASNVYPRLTLEFLATLTRYKSSEGRYISFNALNMVYTMSYLDIARAFNWVLQNDEYVVLAKRDILNFWLVITANRPYRSSGNKIIHVYHLVLVTFSVFSS